MAKKVKVSLVIPNWNGERLLRKNLPKVLKALPKGAELIVVDDGSTDNSVEYIRELIRSPVSALRVARSTTRNLLTRNPQTQLTIKLIENKKNLGFAGGNNVGIKVSRGKYVLFLNPDTVVLPGAIETVLEFMEKHPQVGAATCRLELASGQLDEACHRGFPTPWRAFCHFSGLEKLFSRSELFSGYILGYLLDKKTPHEIDACTGAFMMVRREVGDQVGWWDEDYFWYGEDIDFCYRIKQAGYAIYFLPQVKIIHYRGVTSGIKKHSQKISRARLETRIKAARASTEAMRIFYRKHYLGRYPKVITASVLFAIWLLEKIRVGRIKFLSPNF